MKIRNFSLFLLPILLFWKTALGQVDSTASLLPEFKINGFADVFYGWDFNNGKTDYRLPFAYNHNRYNELNLNLGLVKLAVLHPKYRANLALQSGTYAIDNYASEPEIFKNIYEANVGLSLNQRNTLWLDAGIFPSHIGFETAISMENWTLTRSILADNSPYYLSGAKFSWSPSSQSEWAVLVCNGWQRIQKVKGNTLPSFGTQMKLIPSEKITLNWSTFIGTDDPDSSRRMRYFSNMYAIWQISEKWGLITGFDLGAQQKSKESVHYYFWLSPVIIARMVMNKRWSTSLRAEYYQDKRGVIISTTFPEGFQTSGFSLNLDYAPAKNMVARIEGKWLHSKNQIFEKNEKRISDNILVMGSLAVKIP